MELVNNAFNFDVEKWTISINDAPVMMVGTFKKPWISGKELCNALGYKDIQKTLYNHVKPKHKITLAELKKVQESSSCTFFWPFDDLSYNEGKAVYISEHGAYHLAMKCHLPIGELFRDWLAEEVVPAIREDGQYKLQEALSDSMSKLELKDKEVEEERKQRLRAETRAITLERLNIAFKERQKTSVFYIKTSTVMARDNEFKMGGVESMDKLKSRLKDYESGNSGVHPELTNHFVFVREVADYKQIESRMADLLKPFRSKRHGNTENYNIHYKILSALATMVIDNYDQEIDKFNDFIKMLLEEHQFDQPVVPDFIDIDALPHFVEWSLTRRQFGSATGTKVKLGDLGDEELKNVLRQVIMSIDISDSNVVRRQTVETILSETYNLQAQKRRTWEITKPLLEEAGRVPRY